MLIYRRLASISVIFSLLVAVLPIYCSIISTNLLPNRGVMSPTKGQVIGFWWTNKRTLNSDESNGVEDLGSASPVVPTSSSSLVGDMRYSMLALKGDHMDAAGRKVDYEAIKNSVRFDEYRKLAVQLSSVDLGGMTVNERKAFLINIYNTLVIHALTEGLLEQFPGGTLSRLKLYAKASYNIGGDIYSLNDIENGILRGNRLSAVPLTGLPFRDESDSRKRLVLPCDPRIHFALNCGAVSCPPIAVFSPDNIDEELTDATIGFLDGNTEVNLKEGSISLSMLFSWYRQDFGSTDRQVVDWVRNNASKKLTEKIDTLLAQCPNPTLCYAAYNWDLNS